MRIDEVLAQENAGGEVLWGLADHQGNVRLLMDNQGNVVNNITYDSFGNVTVETNAGNSFRFGYVGKELDSSTGLRHNGVRYVDGHLFISEDPISFDGGDVNLYRYVGNSPTNYKDPSGKFAIAIPVAIGGVIIVGGIIYQLDKSFKELSRDLPKVLPFQDFPDVPTIDKPGEAPDTNPGQPNPNRKKDDNPPPYIPDKIKEEIDKLTDWFEKFKRLFEEQNEENERKEQEKNPPNSCPAPWASNENQPPQNNSEDRSPQNSQNDDNNDSGISDTNDGDDYYPQPVEEDVTDGPHGPERPIADVWARALRDRKSQGRWLSKEAGEKAISNLDTSKMKVGDPYSVPIGKNEGEVIKLQERYPPFPKNTPASERVHTVEADKALVILRKDGKIHTFPIDSSHPDYNTPAPTK